MPSARPHASPPARRHVAIVGAGAAGLASALAHAERGWQVTLIEKGHRLGGRAWARPSDEIDNGPHVLLGCYRSFRRLLRELGAENGFDRRPSLELSFLLRGGALLRLRTPTRVPAPLHLAAGLAGIPGLGAAAGIELLFGAFASFALPPRADETAAAWARRRGLGAWTRRLYLEPLCRAVMNAELHEASALLFVRTLLEAFRGDHAHSAMWIPKRSWHALLHEPAVRFAERRGIHLRLGTRVVHVLPGEHAPGLAFASGERLQDLDRLVIACNWLVAAELLPGLYETRGLRAIAPAPIVTVHFDCRPEQLRFDDPVVALVDGAPFHFACRRAAGDGRARLRTELSLLAGAADELDGLAAEEIAELAAGQLRRWVGRPDVLTDAQVQAARVVRESAATMRHVPGLEALRPPPGPTSRRGLWLAGDWCDTGLPSTLEGAARSAFAPFERGLE